MTHIYAQNDQLTKDKVEEMYKTREEQIHKKQKILDELQKVKQLARFCKHSTHISYTYGQSV